MPPENAFMANFMPILIIIVIFYFLVFRPEQQKQKKHKETVNNLKKNDKVVTAGGIHGTVVNVKDTTVIVRVDDSARMEIDKESVARVKQ